MINTTARARIGLFTLVFCWAPTIFWTPTTAWSAGTDPATGLAISPGWELARAHCGVCHSWRVFITQRGDQTFWTAAIARMQKKHGLWEIPKDQHSELIAYLADNYSPGSDLDEQSGRRPPLAVSLLPALAPSSGQHAPNLENSSRSATN